MIIGIIGKLQAGKTTCSDFIKKNLPKDTKFEKVSFGDSLKEMILKAEICTREELWGTKTQFSRFMLQKIGTEIFRKQVDDNFWINKMMSKLVNIREKIGVDSIIVIDDVRFQNEADLVLSFKDGILIRIIRPEIQRLNIEDKHDSEVKQDLIKSNFEIINDGTLNDLECKIKTLLIDLGF